MRILSKYRMSEKFQGFQNLVVQVFKYSGNVRISSLKYFKVSNIIKATKVIYGFKS